MAMCKYMVVTGKWKACICTYECSFQKSKDIGGDSFHKEELINICTRPNTGPLKSGKIDRCSNP